MRKVIGCFVILVLVFSPLSSYSQKKISSNSVDKVLPKNIILMIGDGMGMGQISSLLLTYTNSNISKFKKIAIMSTYAYDSLVTDSAAGGTALATGYKTRNGIISMGPNGEVYETLFEAAKKKNKATGLVVTSTVTHATPAVFYAHVSSRANESGIATFFTNQVVDVAFGGGLSYFVAQNSKVENKDTNSYGYENTSVSSQNVNLIGVLTELGYTVITNYDALYNFSPNKFSRVLGFLEYNHLPPAKDRKVTLADLTKKALDILSNHKEGFVLMVEGSQIDWECHANNSKGVLSEMKDFDDAIGVVLEFISKNPDTLVVVTADHETGGTFPKSGIVGKVIANGFGSKDHTATFVPVFAEGPGSEKFIGFIDNTDVGKILKSLILEGK